MADTSDVEQALVSVIATALFPNQSYLAGAYQASAALAPWPPAGPGDPPSSAVPIVIRLYRGWPEAATITADVVAGKAHVSVYSQSGMSRNTSRYWPGRQQLATVFPTLTAVVFGLTVTIGGTVTAGNVVGIQLGPAINGTSYAYIAKLGDTLASIAATMAAKIPGASVAGAVITMPATEEGLAAMVMVPQTVALTELRRQDQGIRVSCWAPTPAARDAICSLVDASIAGLQDVNGNLTRFIGLGATGNEAGWIRYAHTTSDDFPARDRVWRRDLCYMVEYPTSLIEQDPIMMFGGGSVEVGDEDLTTEDGETLVTEEGEELLAEDGVTEPFGISPPS